VCVIEDELLGVLSETRDLLGAGLVETLLVQFDIQAAPEQRGVSFQLLGVSSVGFMNGFEIFFETQAVEAGLLKVLRGTDEGAGLAAYGVAESAIGSASFWSEKYESFLGFFGNVDEDAFLVDSVIPCFDASEPVVRRRIGGTAKESNDHQVVNGLAVGEIGMDPETVSGLEIGDLGDGKSGACALNANLDFRTNEVEGGIVGVSCAKEERDGKTCECQGMKTPKAWAELGEAHYFPFTAGLSGSV